MRKLFDVSSGSFVLNREVLERAGQFQIDCIPIPAAIFESGEQGPTCMSANAEFSSLFDGILDGKKYIGSFANRDDLISRIGNFLSSGNETVRFDWIDGGPIGGRYFILHMTRTLTHSDKRCYVMLIDRTATVETERSLRAELLRDSLTGLPNRTAFIEALETALKDGRNDVAVIDIDLKRFSLVNESLGSIAGDELIITVASRLVGALRAGDRLARIGGNEFAILLGADREEAIVATRRIFEALSTPFRLSEMEIRMDVALGYALAKDGLESPSDLLRNAQIAMKRAKYSGRVELYRQDEVSSARRRFSIETELRRAIDNGQLQLNFQPLMDLRSGKLAGFEALSRWHHAEQGWIPPNDFIPVAEESGLIVPLGRWALDSATATLAGWDRKSGANLPIGISVNVSAVQLARDDVARMASRALEQVGLKGVRLTLEVTESALIGDPDGAANMLNALKEIDATIAMDDFGTGYSSLAALQRLPIDVLKIDRSFVSRMLIDRDSLAIVRAILSLANALGMHTTAEGVEAIELSHALAALGCSYGQGYQYARPMAADQAYAFLLDKF